MSTRRRVSMLIVCALLLLVAPGSAQSVPGSPMRIVLLVDSSAAVAPMITQFRAGLNEFLDALPGDPEVMLISTGGQLRVRVPATTDRQKLREGVGLFASDGGANAFLDSLLEADRRFLRTVPTRRSIFVILMTDHGESRGEPRVNEYNRFVNEFQQRGGRAHGIVIRGVNSGITTEIVSNLTENTGGYYETLIIANRLQDRMRALVELLAADQ